MKLVKRVLLGLLGLVVCAIALVYGLSSYRLSRKLHVTEPALTIPTDSASLARGHYLLTAIGKCVECHGPSLGGKLAIDAGPVGTMYAPNLTRGTGGLGATRSDADFVRAIRHGVAPDGRKLMFMPSEVFQFMGDADVVAVVAAVRSYPPVDGAQPLSKVGPLGRVFYLIGQLPPLVPADMVAHNAPRDPVPPAGPTAEYGKYLAHIGGCVGCHGPTLSGGHVPGTPPDFKPASNLTPAGIGHYTETDFIRALREGLRPARTPIDTFMPWRLTRLMTDDDIRAVYAFLKTVPPKEFGGR